MISHHRRHTHYLLTVTWVTNSFPLCRNLQCVQCSAVTLDCIVCFIVSYRKTKIKIKTKTKINLETKISLSLQIPGAAYDCQLVLNEYVDDVQCHWAMSIINVFKQVNGRAAMTSDSEPRIFFRGPLWEGANFCKFCITPTTDFHNGRVIKSCARESQLV